MDFASALEHLNLQTPPMEVITSPDDPEIAALNQHLSKIGII
jgi:hypothetical protein